jgi:hypothetical protein
LPGSATIIGYYGFNFGPDKSNPPQPHTNIWICFKGTSELSPTSLADCNPPATLNIDIWTNMGGGNGNHITKSNLQSLQTQAAVIKNAGFSGLSFDLESVAGYSGPKAYADFQADFLSAISYCKAQGLSTLVTTAKSGIGVFALQSTWPGGFSLASWTKFQKNVVPKFDIYSPQCYDNGHATGTVHEVCSPFGGLDYGTWKLAKQIAPSVSGDWVRQDGGADPAKTLAASTLWPAGVPVTGYVVFDPVPA